MKRKKKKKGSPFAILPNYEKSIEVFNHINTGNPNAETSSENPTVGMGEKFQMSNRKTLREDIFDDVDVIEIQTSPDLIPNVEIEPLQQSEIQSEPALSSTDFDTCTTIISHIQRLWELVNDFRNTIRAMETDASNNTVIEVYRYILNDVIENIGKLQAVLEAKSPNMEITDQGQAAAELIIEN